MGVGYSLSWPTRRLAPPKRGTFFRLQVCEREEFSQVEVYERVRKFVICRSIKGPKGLTDVFLGFEKVEKTFFFSDLFIRDSVFTAVKRDAKFYSKYTKGVPFVNYKVYERGTFSFKIVTKTRRVRGWTLGQNRPRRIP